MVVSVYEFLDKTGQYKSSENGNSYSTAVTQGALVMVLQSLSDSGWFIPIEHEGLQNLLKERQLMDISSSGELLTNKSPLLYSDIIIEGGIITYESNLITGGVGIRYLGTGISNQFREDRVTIYLRVVSSKTGRILKTVSTTKTIISYKVDVGIYKYLSPTSIIESEIGYSSNEPPQVCVQEAIEKAILALIIEGALDGIWSFKDKDFKDNSIIKSYLKEKQDTEYRSPEEQTSKSKNISFSISGGILYPFSDYKEPEVTLGFNGAINYHLNSSFSIGLSINSGDIGPFNDKNKDIIALTSDLNLSSSFNSLFNPYISLGFGGLQFKYNEKNNWKPLFKTTFNNCRYSVINRYYE